MKKTLLLTAALASVALYGCTSSHAPGQPMPRLTFENYQPMTLNVQSSNVVEAYSVQNDPQDVASQFVMAPSEAVKRYVARRFPATGMGDGHFTVAIEDARVHMRSIDQANKVLGWSGIGKEDEYRVMLRLKVTPLPNGARGAASTMLKYDRTIVMPASVTLAQREERQLKFLEELMRDVDQAITTALNDVPNIRQ
jgi:hypothetical protein